MDFQILSAPGATAEDSDFPNLAARVEAVGGGSNCGGTVAAGAPVAAVEEEAAVSRSFRHRRIGVTYGCGGGGDLTVEMGGGWIAEWG
ncbi:hypothetical protein LINPERPRIM_LOCUS11460 [Linum perenne]